MKLIHNYYIDFLKGFKYFLVDVFQDRITRYEFNYGNKSVLQYNLYKDMDFEYPNAYVTLNQIRQETSLFQRNKQLSFQDSTKLEKVASNPELQENLLMDFKWVTLSISIKINFENSMDVLDFYNYFHDHIPGTNFFFYFYKYINFIDLDGLVEHWKDEHLLENIYSKIELTSDKVKRYTTYFNEPILKCINANKVIDNENEIFSIDLDFDVELQVPFQICFEKILQPIEAIDIVVDTRNINPKSVPIITNIDSNDIFRTENIEMVYLINQEDIELADYGIILPIEYQQVFNASRYLTIYITDDYAKSTCRTLHHPFKNEDVYAKEFQIPTDELDENNDPILETINKLVVPIDFNHYLYDKYFNFLEEYEKYNKDYTSIQLITHSVT